MQPRVYIETTIPSFYHEPRQEPVKLIGEAEEGS